MTRCRRAFSRSAAVPLPPIPPEVTWVSHRDFRLVHFAGYAMVVLEVDDGLDVHLAARIARERYAAPFSLARSAGSERGSSARTCS